MVIDEAVTLMGSYNWTRGAAAKSEDLNLVSSPAIAAAAAAYAAHWQNRLAPSSSGSAKIGAERGRKHYGDD